MRTTLITALVWLTMTAAADAAVGELTYAGCLADTGADACFDLPFEPLQQASSAALSPDGRSVYVTGFAGDSITHLFAGDTLALDGCLNDTGSQNCGDLAQSPLDGASDVAVSPNGRSVYVASFGARAVLHFFRASGGQLHYDGCLANDASDGCVDLPGAPLEGAGSVAVSPDGRSVYVGGTTLARFGVIGAEGQIVYTGCLNNDGSDNCVDLPGEPLDGVDDVAVSPDGRSVYATSFTGDAVGFLLRDAATGKLDWDGCLNNDGSDGCVNVPGSPLDGAAGVAVSRDGRSVYVAAAVCDSVSQLARNPATGAPAWVGCLNNDGTDTCADVPGAPLEYANGVAVSADGRSVYVAAYESDAVAHVVRDPRTGRITWGGCLADTGADGCVDVPSAPLNGAQAVAVSPDGRSVFVGSLFSSAVARFARELPVPGTPAPRDTTAPAITRVKVSGRRRITLRYTLSEPAAVRVAFCRKVCRAQRRSARAGANRLRTRLRPGRYRGRLVATDAAGNRSARATTRFRVRRR